jgi:Arc/MetJ-type ribon-helix-helix transcriptional regulator
VADALRQMNSQYQQKLTRLRQALIDGENSGEAVECDLDVLEQESLRELGMGQTSVSPDVCPHA